jgi:outer membrane murein-binding lipoprotein Lpp
MKISWAIILTLLLAGCSSTRQSSTPPSTSLTSLQATTLAMKLANDKAAAAYNRQPFKKQEPILFVDGRWVWIGREGDSKGLQATVDLALDGSTNNVQLQLLSSRNATPQTY